MKRVNLLIVALVLAISAPAAMGETSNLLVPLVVSSETMAGSDVFPPVEFGLYYSLHACSWTEGELGPGNYLSVRFEGDIGKNDYRDRLAGGYDTLTIQVGDHLAIEPGYWPVTTYVGLRDRIHTETDPRFWVVPTMPGYSTGYNPDAWDNWLASRDPITEVYPRTWRIMTMPVIEDTTIPGSGNVVVSGFADFFIERIFEKDTTEADGTVHYAGDIDGRFIPGAELEPIPEPSGLIALGGGVLALAGCILRRRSAIREGAARPAIIVLDKSVRA